MSRSKKPRKAYRPKPVINSLDWGINGSAKFDKDSIAEILRIVEESFLVMKQGKATAEEWNMIAQALNISEALAQLNIGSNLTPHIRAGQWAMNEVGKRMIAGRNSVLRAQELHDIDEALIRYHAQLTLCSVGEYRRAVKGVINWHTGRGMAGNNAHLEAMLSKEIREAAMM